ncbi:uncharacterized protein [Hoplias malabaricus]|uniref:uncharacterized protein isoform X2 n=1 Tax=Hoplias malabaricus TaxID=27720 RepID=UPI003463558F
MIHFEKQNTDVKDLISRSKQSNGFFWPSTSSAETFECDYLQNDWAVFPPPDSSLQINRAELTFPSHSFDAFQATPTSWLTELSQTGLSNQKTDNLQPYEAKMENADLLRAVTSENEGCSEPSGERDYLLEYVLAHQRNDDSQPLPFPAVEPNGAEAFQDPFPPVFNADVFSDTGVSASGDIFHTPVSGLFQSTPLCQNSTSTTTDIKVFDPFSDDYIEKDGLFKEQKVQSDGQFTASVNTSRDGPPDVSPVTASADGVLMFRRRPPKPVPRGIRKNLNQAVDFQPQFVPPTSAPAHSGNYQSPLIPIQAPPTSTPDLSLSTPVPPTFSPAPPTFSSPPIPVSEAKASIQNVTSAKEENQNQVYVDVLLIGQERCVEDWPEDSPQLSPDWKPPGKLRLRRDSLRITAASEEGVSLDTLGKKHGKKLSKKLRSSFLSRRGSRDQFGEEMTVAQTATLGRHTMEKASENMNDGYGGTLPWRTKFHDLPSDDVFSSDQEEHGATVTSKSVKKKKYKIVVPRLHYRTSKIKSHDEISENGTGLSPHLQASKDELFEESCGLQSDGKPNSGKEMQLGMKDCRPNPLNFKPVVPLRPSKRVFEDDLPQKRKDLHFLEKPKDSVLQEEGATGFTPSSEVGFQDEPFPLSGAQQFASLDDSGPQLEMLYSRPKKSVKLKMPRFPRRGSKSAADEAPQKGADLFKASDVKGSELKGHDDYHEMKKPPILRVPPLARRDSECMKDPEITDKGADLFKAGDLEDGERWTEEYSPDVKPQTDKRTQSREAAVPDQALFPEDVGPVGATSSDFYLSEAAKAEWMSSQMDVRRTRPDEGERLEDVEEEEEGDTDSLMEWWNTVEQWDELPSDEEITLKEDETISFTEIGGKVHRGLRVFYKVFTEQAEVLYQQVLFLYAIADDLSIFHHRAKIANITGGTTTAVGGVAAIAGLALAPVTFGASLIVSAVGLGVATAGGITAASAAISDNINDMNDRKKIEIIVQDYETRLSEMQRCLRFVAEGIRRIRCHRLLRRNNYYAGNWEVRQALQTVSLVSEPVEKAKEVVDAALVALSSVCKGMDKYFTKDSRELKKGCKKEVTMRVRMLAKQLHDGLVQLNSIREQLLDATGHI